MWIFGYGSLLWYTDFPYEKVMGGEVRGFVRRFWQLSPDHRGTPEEPGRTVTLVREEGGSCWGLAYKVPDEHVDSTVSYLNFREKAGYVTEEVLFHPDDGSDPFKLCVYIAATEDNPHYAGPTDDELIAREVLIRSGPSGPNLEYALRVAQEVRRRAPHVKDKHLFKLEMRLLELVKETGKGRDIIEALGYQN